MTAPKDTPAALRRRIAKLEALLSEERQMRERLMSFMHEEVARLVIADVKLRQIREVMDEE